MSKPSSTAKARAKCARILKATLGPGGYRHFLRSRQPALDDRTGAELMKADPIELLKRVMALEKQVEGGKE